MFAVCSAIQFISLPQSRAMIPAPQPKIRP